MGYHVNVTTVVSIKVFTSNWCPSGAFMTPALPSVLNMKIMLTCHEASMIVLSAYANVSVMTFSGMAEQFWG
jgi:hypothetical protein